MRLRDLALRPHWSLRPSATSGLHSGTLTSYLTSSRKSGHALHDAICSSGSGAVIHAPGAALPAAEKRRSARGHLTGGGGMKEKR